MGAAFERQMQKPSEAPHSRAILDRRGLLAGALLAALPGFPRGDSADLIAESDEFASIVDPAARIEALYQGGLWCEGPVWVPRLDGLVFSDVRNNRMLLLREGRPAEIFREPSANANGNALDARGRLITCEHRNRRVVRQEPDGSFTVLADRHLGRRLNSPNDVAVTRDGAIWFTDPTYGIDSSEEGIASPSEQTGRFVYRLDPSGRFAVAADGFVQPNGLAFSPNEETLYISDTESAMTPAGRREIRAFAVAGDGRLSKERVFATLEHGVPDGLALDEAGRLYAGVEGGVRIWRPDSQPVGRIAIPGPCANLAFGGRDGRRLYLCCGARVFGVTLKVRGVELVGGLAR